MAYYAFLRIGEITVTTQSRAVLQFNQLTKMFNSHGTNDSIQVHFTSFKHHYNGHPISVILSRQPVICPVDTFMSYLEFRGSFPGPIFRHPDGSPVTRSEFSEWLASAIKGRWNDRMLLKNTFDFPVFKVHLLAHALRFWNMAASFFPFFIAEQCTGVAVRLSC